MSGTALLLVALAAAPDDPAVRLQNVRAEIQELEQTAKEAGSREKSVMAEVQRLDRVAALRREEVSVLRQRAADVQAKVNTSEERLLDLEGQVEVRADSLVQRMEEVRRFGRIGYLGSLLPRSRRGGFLTGLRQVSYLAERDRRQIDELRARTEDLRRIRADLERTNQELVRLQNESRQAERQKLRVRGEKAALLESLRKERQRALDLKAELQAAEEGLQHLVGGLASAPGSAAPVPFRLYRRALPWPVVGRVSQEFGNVADTRFDIPFPGIDIWAPADTPVRSVASGTVVFADWFRGYGKTVCIDHGDGYISVYSHLAEYRVRPGQKVLRTETIARVGDTGSLKGPHLYFQISQHGQPLDPREWLEPRGGVPR